MRVFTGVGHQRARRGRNDWLTQHAPAGVGDELHAEALQRGDVAGLLSAVQRGTAAGHDDRHRVVLTLNAAQVRQRRAFAQGKMRVAEGDDIDVGRLRAVQFAPAVQQVRRTDAQGFVRRMPAEGQLCGGRFGRHAGHVKHWRSRGGGEGRAEGLEVIQRRSLVLQTADHRNRGAAQQPYVIAEQRVEAVVQAVQFRDVDAQRRQPLLRQVAPDFRRAAGEGDADVEVVRVFQRTRADHAVGIHHGVGFGPDDLLAQLGCAVEQVRRASEADPRAHVHVGIAQLAGRLAEGRIDAEFAPAALVHRDRIKGRGDANLGAPFHQLTGEAQAGRPCVDATVDVRLGDVQQLGRALQFCDAQDDAHRHLRGFAIGAVEQALVGFAQADLADGVDGGSVFRPPFKGWGRVIEAGYTVPVRKPRHAAPRSLLRPG
nr:hypothetical protein [Tanacetum cinerariifolium]